MMRLSLVLILCLTACSPAPEAEESETLQIDVSQALGGDDTAGFLRADAPREFSFPEDHGLHPGFRNEWWYLTGNLVSETGRQFGYQLTFFSTSLRGDTEATQGWESPRIWMAHAAITDVESRTHTALERFSRENPGLAGASNSPYRVWLENWSLSSASPGSGFFPWRLQIEDEAFSLNLLLDPEKPAVLQGDRGLSQKSTEAGNASYYYSLTRLASSGTLVIGGQDYELDGNSWLDREWSTSALAEDQSGWDWFSLQFDDGQELMYYRLRDREGKAHPNSDGNWTTQAAEQIRILPQEISLQELVSWRAPNGIDYTTRWRMNYRDQSWIIQALVDDQFMNLSVPYWEGAVAILDPQSAEILGHGYLEMVRSPPP